MTKKDFFRILIKVFGLYSLITALFVLPSQLSFVLYELEFIGILYILGILAFIALIFLFLIKNPDTIIKWLKLDHGFDDERIFFEKLDSRNIFKIGVIIIGGLLLIENIPSFLSFTFFAFKSDINRQGLEVGQQINWASSFLQIIIGYLLVTQFDKISSWIKAKEEISPINNTNT
jgi:hypothetical protein